MKFRIQVWYCDQSVKAPQSAESSLVDWLVAEVAASASLTAVPQILTEKKKWIELFNQLFKMMLNKLWPISYKIYIRAKLVFLTAVQHMRLRKKSTKENSSAPVEAQQISATLRF